MTSSTRSWPLCASCGATCDGAAAPIGPPALRVTFACHTRSESNGRDRWAKIARTKQAREATIDAIAIALGEGQSMPIDGPWLVRFTRLGVARLDRGNLPHALKSVEDTIASILKVDDGHPSFRAVFAQSLIPKGGTHAVTVEVWGGGSAPR